jgi:hypothetical protein
MMAETYRYRMTVVVDTPAGRRSGSSVIQVKMRPGGLLSGYAYVADYHGEAVAIDLPGGRTLYALLTKPQASYGADFYALEAYRDVLPHTSIGGTPSKRCRRSVRRPCSARKTTRAW